MQITSKSSASGRAMRILVWRRVTRYERTRSGRKNPATAPTRTAVTMLLAKKVPITIPATGNSSFVAVNISTCSGLRKPASVSLYARSWSKPETSPRNGLKRLVICAATRARPVLGVAAIRVPASGAVNAETSISRASTGSLPVSITSTAITRRKTVTAAEIKKISIPPP